MPCDGTNITSCRTVNLTSSVTPGLEDFINASISIATSAALNLTTFNTTTTPTPLNPTTFPVTVNTTSFLPLHKVANLSAPSPGTAVNSSVLREAPLRLDTREVVVTLCLSLLTIVANLLVLFLTKFAGGGQSPTMVFVRMLCVSDFFLGCYGLGKMLMFLHVDGLLINFFLPESLFFTAATSSCLSLLLLNLDRCVKMAWPLWYVQHVDKSSIITGMVFLWNVSFVLGFLPLLGWNSHDQTFLYDLFGFYSGPYLLLMGAVWVACVAGSLAVLLWVRNRFDLTLGGQGGQLSYHLGEVEKYCKLRGTLLLDLLTWALCYLPFLAFLALACRSCPLGGRPGLRAGVYHFVPVFMLRSLGGAGLQLYRTVYVQGLRKKRGRGAAGSAATNHHHHHQQQQHQHWGFSHKRLSEENGVSTISYSNPLCDNSSSASELVHLENTVSSSASLPPLADAYSSGVQGEGEGEEEEEGEGAQGGISNPAYRPSIHFDVGLCGVTEEITAL